MQASASTWVYNLALDLARLLITHQPVKGVFVPYRGHLQWLDDTVPVVKSRGVDAPTEASLSRRAHAIIISIRDPRDCVASLVKYHSLSFREALQDVEYAATNLADDRRAILLRYESQFTEKLETIDQIAAVFGQGLSPDQRNLAFRNSRREAIEKLISKLEQCPSAQRAGNDIYDAERHWHKVHANRTGAIGKWRDNLTPRDVARIELRLAHRMREFGYLPGTKPKLIDRAADLFERFRPTMSLRGV
ncbi:MAG: hypothetical protein JO122_06800 [Acetobacteraceae bacterium]|nr:hypothetical protein [Acetobacteraceae bacterium]